MSKEEYTPVTQQVLNSLTIGKKYTFISGASPCPVEGVPYKHENGNTYIHFGNIPIYPDWKVKL